MKTQSLRLAGAAAGLAASLLVGLAVPAHAQNTPCRYQLGFATLARLVGPRIGDCLEHQRTTPEGNSEQRTGSGLLVWRKADNWTAFTDGHRTWINGPNGLEQRLNGQRFPWEPDLGAPGTVPYAPPAPPPVPAEPAPLVPGTQLGVPVSGPTLQMTALTFERTAPGGPGSRMLKVGMKVETGPIAQRGTRYAYWDFRLRSPQGVEYKPSAYAAVTRPGALGDGTLFRDGFVVGDLYFEVPDDGQGYGLHYYPQGITSSATAISRWLGGAS